MKFKIVLLVSLFMSSLSLFAKSEGKLKDSYLLKRGIEAYTAGNNQEALDWINKELDEHPDNGYAYIYLSALRYGNDEYGKALSAINEALKKLPKKDKESVAMAYETRAWIYLVMGDTVSTLKDCDMTIKLEPRNKDHYEHRSQVYFEQKRYDLADADYRQMIALDPGDVMGYMGIGRNAKEQKRYDDAIEQFNYVIKMEPDYDSGYSFRAECYIAQKRYSEAIDDILKALSLSGDRKAFLLLLNIDKEAIPVVKAKLQIEANKKPNDAQWYYILGLILENNNQLEDAIKYYELAHHRDANSVFLERISQCYFDKGDFDSALDYVNRAINMNDNDYDLVMLKGNIYNEMGKYPEAIAELDNYIEKNPDNYFGYYYRGWCKEESKDIEGAIEDYTMSITLEPQYAYAYMGRGKFYKNQGKEDLAKADFEKVIELDTVPDPDLSCAHYAYYYLGQKDKAIEFMDKLIAKDSDASGCYYDAACLYSIMGEKEKAIDFLKKSLEYGFNRFAHIKVDDELDNIREMPEFKELLEKYSVKKNDGDTKRGDEVPDYNTEIVEIPFTKESGVTKVKCSINGLPLHFVFDTGASDITLSLVEANFMLKNDYIKPSDIIGSARYVDANGDITEGTVVNLRNVNFGGLNLDNVRASVVRNQKAPLLLGQSVLGRLGKIEIDNPGMKLKITHKK